MYRTHSPLFIVVFPPLGSKLSEGGPLSVLLAVSPEAMPVPVVGVNRYLIRNDNKRYLSVSRSVSEMILLVLLVMITYTPKMHFYYLL